MCYLLFLIFFSCLEMHLSDVHFYMYFLHIIFIYLISNNVFTELGELLQTNVVLVTKLFHQTLSQAFLKLHLK